MDIQKLTPVCKNYIWGGTKLKTKYGKRSDDEILAESWELSFHKDGLTLLSDGSALIDRVTGKELGENAARFPFFPTLIKFIDAKADLSLQVHPSDEYALKNEDSFGKTEMWYIVEADEGAGIYLGFNDDVTEKDVRLAIADNTIGKLLNFYPVKEGETYFIPSGTIHAILKGCLILEIQQNSNLTYRVYDYDRVDKNGNKRPLHVEKALRVVNFDKFSAKKRTGGLLGVSKYFTVEKFTVGKRTFKTDGKTFNCLTCVKGSGRIQNLEMNTGDSFFVPADYGEYTVEGKAEVVVTSVRKYYVGIDLGGTFIKGGIVDDTGRIIISESVPTEREKGDVAVAEKIAALCNSLLASFDMTAADVEGLGIGVPGLIDGLKGQVVYSNNLNWSHFDIAEEVEKRTGMKVRIANDADVAALGEYKFGAGRGVEDMVMITLGTGVGSGVVIGGKLYTGNCRSGVEIGHMVVFAGGNECTCGKKGCFEAHCSASALIALTKKKMLAHPDSKMWDKTSIDLVNGKTAFDHYYDDEWAKEVVNEYIEALSIGIVNVSNVFRPQKIIIGGGLSAQKELLITPLQKAVDTLSFGGKDSPKCEVVAAEAGNEAGIIGAAALLTE